jgi:hypothetical protein
MSSVLFAEVVGFTALVSARLIFPLYARFLRVAYRRADRDARRRHRRGSAAILATRPLYLLANLR